MTFEIHSNITNRSMTVAARAMRRGCCEREYVGHLRLERVFIQRIAADPIRWRAFCLRCQNVDFPAGRGILLSVLLFQDRFNGMIARKNAGGHKKEYHVAFGEDSYTVWYGDHHLHVSRYELDRRTG